MSQSATPAFKIECPDCGITQESDDFDDVSRFEEKHSEHTGHEVQWVQADFGFDLGTMTKWVLACDTCNDTWKFDSKREADRFRREHSEYTNHRIASDPEEQPFDLPDTKSLEDADSVKTIIHEMTKHYEAGVPEKAVYAVLANDTSEVAKARSIVERMKRQGEVYEVKTGHLRTT